MIKRNRIWRHVLQPETNDVMEKNISNFRSAVRRFDIRNGFLIKNRVVTNTPHCSGRYLRFVGLITSEQSMVFALENLT